MVGIARSQALIVFKSVSVGQSKTFGVPANHVVLVKSVALHNAGTAVADAHVFAGSGAGGANVYLLMRTLAVGEVWTWEGFVALNPGDNVSVQLWGTDMECWVSGAVLNGPNQFPIATLSYDEWVQVNQLPA